MMSVKKAHNEIHDKVHCPREHQLNEIILETYKIYTLQHTTQDHE